MLRIRHGLWKGVPDSPTPRSQAVMGSSHQAHRTASWNSAGMRSLPDEDCVLLLVLGTAHQAGWREDMVRKGQDPFLRVRIKVTYMDVFGSLEDLLLTHAPSATLRDTSP